MISCPGFKAGGVASGLKQSEDTDLGLIFSEAPANVAGVFTRNRVQAAPVLVDRERIQSGICQAVIVNSGNANCCTGDQGIRDAQAMARHAASALGISEDLVMVASTGVIGVPLPIEKIEAAIPGLVSSLSTEGFDELAEAMMTTDTMPKTIAKQGRIGDKTFTVAGVAKGSGMIRPDMATMLCFVCTDIDADSDELRKALVTAADRSFNRITVDGDTSTNDMVLLMANGLSRAALKNAADRDTFQDVLDEVLMDLARKIVKDGEGATKVVEILVKGAMSDKDARQVAETVANSSLVKTAFFGEDANWGRIIAAAGRAEVPIDAGKIDIFFDDVQMCRNGIGCGGAIEGEATKVLEMPEFTVTIDLKTGEGNASVFTCDFSYDYVKINADYRS